MTNSHDIPWEEKRTDETRQVEKVLLDAGFDQVDAYRYNSVAIRLRVIDRRFENLPLEKREDMVDPVLEQLPDETQADIMSLYVFAPSEVEQDLSHIVREGLLNLEFVDPSPSLL